MVEIFRIVENALAGIARNDLIVAANFLKDLRPDANLANFAHFVSSSSNRDSATRLANTFISRDQIGRDRSLDFLPLL
jgi:hypothetical protein